MEGKVADALDKRKIKTKGERKRPILNTQTTLTTTLPAIHTLSHIADKIK